MRKAGTRVLKRNRGRGLKFQLVLNARICRFRVLIEVITMTWGEFKRQVENLGVTEDSRISFIDVASEPNRVPDLQLVPTDGNTFAIEDR